jgi:hypothetical protein
MNVNNIYMQGAILTFDFTTKSTVRSQIFATHF